MDEKNLMESEFKVNKIEKVEKMEVDDVDSRESNKRQKGNIESENENCEPRQGKNTTKPSELIINLIDSFLSKIIGFDLSSISTGQYKKGNTLSYLYLNLN